MISRKLFVAIFFCVLFFTACQKGATIKPVESTLESTKFLSNLSLNRSNLSIVLNSYSFSNDFPSTIDVYGGVVDKNGNLISIDQLEVAGIEIEKKENKFLSHFNKLSNEDNFTQIVNKFTDPSVKIKFMDDELGKLETQIAGFTPIQLEFSEEMNGELNKSNGLTVKWNPINNNSISSDKEVGVAVTYHSRTSQRIDPTLPSENIIVKKVALDTDGEIYFSPEELSTLPANGIVIVYIARGEQSIVEYGKTETVISYVTSSSSENLTIH